MSKFYSGVRLLGATIWSPSQAFDEIGSNQVWLLPYLVVSVGSATITWISLPILQDASLLSMTDLLSSQQEERLSWIHQVVRYGSVVGTFLTTLISWFLSAFILWLLVQVFEGLPSFKVIFSVVAHANVISLLSGMFVLVLLLNRAHQGYSDPRDLDIAIGLDLFLKSEVDPAWRVISASLNPFNLWYYGLLAIGVERVCRLGMAKSAGIVGLFWLTSLLLGAGLALVASSVGSLPTPK